jgi:hypothetical protein
LPRLFAPWPVVKGGALPQRKPAGRKALSGGPGALPRRGATHSWKANRSRKSILRIRRGGCEGGWRRNAFWQPPRTGRCLPGVGESSTMGTSCGIQAVREAPGRSR